MARAGMAVNACVMADGHLAVNARREVAHANADACTRRLRRRSAPKSLEDVTLAAGRLAPREQQADGDSYRSTLLSSCHCTRVSTGATPARSSIATSR